ncbi:MAG: MFS transporter [Proteobacteria bacterium]|nr:MFS transporter [Pseudomonadota bacterium]
MKLSRRILSLPGKVYYVLLGVLLINLGSFLVIPFFTIYFTKTIHLPLTIIGLAFSIQIIAQRSFALISGYVIDKYNPKICLMTGLLLGSSAYLGLAFVNGAWSLCFYSALLGLGNAFFNPASKAAIVKQISSENRAFAFALRNTAMNIGVSCGPLIGSVLLHFAPRIVFLTALVIYLFCFFMFSFLKNTSGCFQASQVKFIETFALLKTPIIGILVGFMALFMSGYVQIDLTMPLLAHDLNSKWGIISIFAVNSLTVTLLAVPLTNIILKPGKSKLIVSINLLFLFFSLIIYGFSKNLAMAMFAMLLFSITEILFFPALDSLLSENCPTGFIGRTFGLLELGGALGGVLGNMLGGFFYHRLLEKNLQPYYWLTISIFLSMISILFIYFLFLNKKINFQPGKEII